jgi:hypothetical protein
MFSANPGDNREVDEIREGFAPTSRIAGFLPVDEYPG